MRSLEKLCRFQVIAFFTMAICLIVYLLMMHYVQTSSTYFLKTQEVPATAFIPWLKTRPDRSYNFQISVDKSIHVIDDRFLSFTVDSSQIRKGLINPSLWDEKLRRIVKHLGGGYVRFGGTAGDLLVFSPGFRVTPEQDVMLDGSSCAYENGCSVTSSLRMTKKFSMTAENWKAINSFAEAVKMKLLFQLNVLLRNAFGGWNSTNAELILDIAFAYQYNIDWELGNEPNAFRHVFGPDMEVPPKNLSTDFTTLRTLLNRYSLYNASKLVGPDVTNPRDHDGSTDESNMTLQPDVYLSQFLDGGADVDAVTWHHYYIGRNATMEDFLDVNTFNSFISSTRRMVDIVKLRTPQKPIWIGETGSSYGGGAPLSDRFVSSLLWMDKLGVAAREGISVVIRQSIYAGHYALLGDALRPNPDYWVSALHKRFVGRKVLNITCFDEVYDHMLRAYAHCSKDMKLTVFGVNIANTFLGLTLKMNATADFYSLSSSLDSKLVYLNGNLLMLDYDTQELPPFHPVVVDMNELVPIPPYSIFFLHIDSLLPACLNA
uniref:Heparanase n=1 Tax=Lygus hesperus TaxID=30085 RepID=A0A0A9XZA7_LYGHE